MSLPANMTVTLEPVRVALIGNPNTGKSTLFNALAGMNVRTGNYPGVTVERKTGRAVWKGQAVELIDLPGTYSLSPQSPDEMVAVNILTGADGSAPPDAVVCICNAAALERNLFLVTQIREIGLPVILCLNMWDAAQKAGFAIDLDELSRRLGIPVVTTSALQKRGLAELQDAILNEHQIHAGRNSESAGSDNHRHRAIPDILTSPLREEVGQLGGWLAAAGCPVEKRTSFLVMRSLLDPGGSVQNMLARQVSTDYNDQLHAARARLEQQGILIPQAEATQRYAFIKQLLRTVQSQSPRTHPPISETLDGWLTHRFFGFVICMAVMLLVFSTIYWFSQPLSEMVERGIGWLSDLVMTSMAPGLFRSLLVDGIIAGVGSVLIFLPQISLLFLFIALLEDCGYMARAAFMMDRLMALVGLSGRSFLPLMSSFACAVPGIMATRVIDDRKDRFVTILIAPLMSCSARLPVYLLMIGMFVPDHRYLGGTLPLHAIALLGISMLGLIVAVPTAFLLRRTFFRGEPSAFLLELPDYRIPSLRVTTQRVWGSSRSFVENAGTLIFATTVIIWAAGSFPGSHEKRFELMTTLEALPAEPVNATEAENIEQLQSELNSQNASLLENSLLGRFGHAVEPLVRPLGWDWRIGVGVVASFPAREVIIATLGTIFSLGSDVDEEHEGLRDALLAARHQDGTPVFNLPVAISVMVFFALCAQCVSTLVVMKRETNSWGWPAFSFVYMTSLAWIAAFATYQIGMRL